MAQLGMDVDQVETAAKGINADAERLAQLVRQIDGVVRRIPGVWDGADARDFVNQWWPRHKQGLLAAVDGVSGLGQSALNNAAEQRRVSDSTGGADPGSSSGGAAGNGSGVNSTDGFDLLKSGGDLTGALAQASWLKGGAAGLGIVGATGALLSGDNGPDGQLTLLSSLAGGVASVTKGSVGDVAGGVGGALSVGADGYKTYEDIQNNNVGGAVFDGVHGVATGVGIAIPVVGECVMAADVGIGIGTIAGNAYVSSDYGQQQLQSAYDVGAGYVKQPGMTDVQTADAMVDRYSGVGGFFNFEFDSGVRTWNQVSGFVGGLFK
jgi:uncharacterized protein YukE